jgi:hypothetical protein
VSVELSLTQMKKLSIAQIARLISIPIASDKARTESAMTANKKYPSSSSMLANTLKEVKLTTLMDWARMLKATRDSSSPMLMNLL